MQRIGLRVCGQTLPGAPYNNGNGFTVLTVYALARVRKPDWSLRMGGIKGVVIAYRDIKMPRDHKIPRHAHLPKQLFLYIFHRFSGSCRLRLMRFSVFFRHQRSDVWLLRGRRRMQSRRNLYAWRKPGRDFFYLNIVVGILLQNNRKIKDYVTISRIKIQVGSYGHKIMAYCR